jgi:hypothetical protein
VKRPAIQRAKQISVSEENIMETKPEPDRIDPHFRARREQIATAVLAQLVGHAGSFRHEDIEAAVQAADALIRALDSEGI